MKVTKTIWLSAYVQDGKNQSWNTNDSKLNSGPFVHATSQEVTFDVPDDFDFRQPMIERLREEQKEIQAKAELARSMLEEQISKLLSIEYDAQEGDDDIPF